MDLRDGGCDDRELMARAARGDRDAFAAIYARHQAAVYRFARLMTGSEAIAQDVVQDVFVALMSDAARYDARRATLSTYLYGSARHHTRRRLARERRFVGLDAPNVSAAAVTAIDPISDLSQDEEILRLRRAIVSLPSRYREIIVLCELQDRSYAEAAQISRCAIGTVRSRLSRARHMLADKMRRGEARANARAILRCPA
jgi:RNA polymerase sigma-70 factor (ECF subfamily)